MTETYTLVGSQSTWLLGLAPLVVVPVLLVRKRTQPDTYLGWLNWYFAWYAISFAIGMPQEWILGGSLWVIALSSILPKRGPLRAKKSQRFILLACLPIGLAIAAIPVLVGGERIVLADHNATDSLASVTRASVARQGLVVHASYDSRDRAEFLFGGRSYTWTSYGADQSAGPDVTSQGEYWGPHGLVSGNELGRHLAAWAGATIQYRDYAKPAKVASRLPEK
ncbi:MAG TPA: hypothetical protein VG820_01970 [Fimbriimonadaceae bacterium]|nr:hypothetical protein [Fimbriimonadaceae bacterium]